MLLDLSFARHRRCYGLSAPTSAALAYDNAQSRDIAHAWCPTSHPEVGEETFQTFLPRNRAAVSPEDIRGRRDLKKDVER